jgi:hypothetical protein
VAGAENIDVTKKLQIAQEEIDLELQTMLGRMSDASTAQSEVRKVVATTSLKAWHSHLALEMVYTDAYFSQLNDRYASKRDQYHVLAKAARERVIQTGVGMVADPVRRAGAAEVVASTGGYLAVGVYYVTTAWVNRQGEVGASGPPAVIQTSGETFRVSVGDAPAEATGWNIYAGPGPESMVQQNDTPIAPNQTWLQPALRASGRAPGNGQEPGYVKQVPRIIQRG